MIYTIDNKKEPYPVVRIIKIGKYYTSTNVFKYLAIYSLASLLGGIFFFPILEIMLLAIFNSGQVSFPPKYILVAAILGALVFQIFQTLESNSSIIYEIFLTYKDKPKEQVYVNNILHLLNSGYGADKLEENRLRILEKHLMRHNELYRSSLSTDRLDIVQRELLDD